MGDGLPCWLINCPIHHNTKENDVTNDLITPTLEQADKLPEGTKVLLEVTLKRDGVDQDGDFYAVDASGSHRYVNFTSAKVSQADVEAATRPKLPTAIGSIIQLTKWYGCVSGRQWRAVLVSGGRWIVAVDSASSTGYTAANLQGRVNSGDVEFTEVVA